MREYVFRQEKKWAFSRESRTGRDDVKDGTSINVVIKSLNNEGQFIRVLVVECKHANAYPTDIAKCEAQTSTGCPEYIKLHPNERKRTLYALTYIGTKARLWEHTGNSRLPRLTAYFPPASARGPERYCDIDSEDGEELFKKLIQTRAKIEATLLV